MDKISIHNSEYSDLREKVFIQNILLKASSSREEVLERELIYCKQELENYKKELYYVGIMNIISTSVLVVTLGTLLLHK
jgi:hypothetical protein